MKVNLSGRIKPIIKPTPRVSLFKKLCGLSAINRIKYIKTPKRSTFRVSKNANA